MFIFFIITSLKELAFKDKKDFSFLY